MDVKLNTYEGPLDLLLQLIERNEIDIYDIPIAQLTDQYLSVLREMPNDMEGMSEFVLMAATLLEIKSRTLLPKKQAAPGTNEEEDPREALVQKLLEYKRCQALAEQLRTAAPPGERVVRESERLLIKQFNALDPEKIMDGVSLTALWQVFSDVVRRRELRIDPVRASYGDMPRERFTVEEMTARIESYLSERGAFRLADLWADCVSREEMLVTFLALLEMIRRGRLHVRQATVFAEIYCEAGDQQA